MFGSRLVVKKYEKSASKYEARPVETGKLLFYGHSYFNRCSAIYTEEHPEKSQLVLEKEVRMKDGSQAIVNHGFGGSSADDLLYYYDRLVRPYAPRALFLTSANNDINKGYSAPEIMNILATLIDWFQADFPDAPVYCFNWTPTLVLKGATNSITRIGHEFNELLKAYCEKKEGVTFIPWQEFPFFFEKEEDIGDYDKVWEEVYDVDQKHLNEFGYGRFMNDIRRYLDAEGLLD